MQSKKWYVRLGSITQLLNWNLLNNLFLDIYLFFSTKQVL